MNLTTKHGVVLLASLLLTATACNRNRSQYDATGNFEATEVIVSSEVNGRILAFPVSEGDVLTAGAEAGLIDSTQLHLQRLQIESNIRALRSSRPDVEQQLAPLEEQLAKQRREKQRVENLLQADVTTEKQLDAQRTSLQNSVTSIDAQIAAAEAQLGQLEEQLAKCRITSPIDGTVLAKYAQAGELAIAGKPLMKVADVAHIYLRAYLLSSQLANVKLGQPVKVYADFGKGSVRTYEGTVTWISDQSEFTPKNIVTADDRANMVYAVKIAVPNDGYLKIGMYGGINF